MNITVFSSNQPRHLSLIRLLADIADTVFVIQECTTIMPGILKDTSYSSTNIMSTYFTRMRKSESLLFGNVGFSPKNTRTISLQMGDVSSLPLSSFGHALNADIYIVFGASWIRGKLVDALIERRAINIHMGVSPYYRGSACNFWALNDGNADLVGATIHLISKGLDSGRILFHALPAREPCEPFDLGMKAVEAAHQTLARVIKSNLLGSIPAITQTISMEIRYTRNSDFTDEVAADFLNKCPSAQKIGELLTTSPQRQGLILL